MALPSNFGVGTVTGRWVTSHGRVGVGRVTFTPRPVMLVSQGTETVVVPRPHVADLVNGEINVTLPATNDPDVTPLGWTWACDCDIEGFDIATFDMALPEGTVVDLSTVVAVPPGEGTTIVAHGLPTGGVPGDVLTKATVTDFDTSWQPPTGGVGGGAVVSVNGQTGAVVLDATDVSADVAGAAAAVAGDLAAHEALTTGAHSGIVASTDPRLTDARTPLAHTHVEADVTGLSGDLAARPTSVSLAASGGAGVVGFDGAVSGFSATDVQGAVDELTAAVSAELANKEAVGVAAGLVAGLPDLTAGAGIDLIPGAGTLTVAQQGAVIDDFTTPGTATWTKPAGASLVMVTCLGGGGGGGSGRKGAEGTDRFGGCGGMAGNAVSAVFPASMLPATVTVTVGGGGAGAAGQTLSSSDGQGGGGGGASSFGAFVSASGGFGGVKGSATAVPTMPASALSQWQVGAVAGNGNEAVLGPRAGGSGHAGNGGAGGYRTSANANSILVGLGGNGVGGTGVATPGAAGTNGSDTFGGGGGTGNTPGSAGNAPPAGAGGAPSGGGGGGGAGVNGVGNSGAGGQGGRGMVRVVTLR